MAELTFIIPIAPYHDHIAARAVASVQAQSIPCEVLSHLDSEKRGPAVVRNKMLAQVTTPFVVWLDADDWIEPTFAERTLAFYRQQSKPNCYVYTDWYAGERLVQAPEKAWINGAWHVITALIRTEDAQRIKGFDEQIAGLEDTEFWLKLNTNGVRGVRLSEPLFHYGSEGQRAVSFKQDQRYGLTMQLLTTRYGGRVIGDELVVNPVNGYAPGFMLAQARWGGNRYAVGKVTGNVYAYMSAPDVAWIDARDLQADPRNWLAVPSHVNNWQQAIARIMQPDPAKLNRVLSNVQYPRREGQVVIRPDVDGLLQRYQAVNHA